ncbi:MAG: cyclic-di-AMP receptor [Oscillospiraceae bacterium]|nr:cyclic-di-AMP receptor [Oscillospiraceae bacterium]MDD3260552.1 cyclic-di-AMP receptor [Oscillospiraceae bacterium]
MKLVLAIVNTDDAALVNSSLTRAGFRVTKLATTGGFLKSGNTTFIIGTEDDKVEKVLKLLRGQCSRRTQVMPSTAITEGTMYSSYPIEVTVGGATVFVLDVDRFEKL